MIRTLVFITNNQRLRDTRELFVGSDGAGGRGGGGGGGSRVQKANLDQ